MKKLPSFIVAKNPMVDHRVFIIHARNPRFIAEPVHFNLDQEKEWMQFKRESNLGASVDYPGKLIAIRVHWIEDNDQTAQRLAKLMSRMGDWYHAYLKFEDSQ